jgi:hypothetical protein
MLPFCFPLQKDRVLSVSNPLIPSISFTLVPMLQKVRTLLFHMVSSQEEGPTFFSIIHVTKLKSKWSQYPSNGQVRYIQRGSLEAFTGKYSPAYSPTDEIQFVYHTEIEAFGFPPQANNRTTEPNCSASFWYVFFPTGLPSNEVTYQVLHPSRQEVSSVEPGPSSLWVLPHTSDQHCNTALETNECPSNRFHSRTFHFWMFLALQTQVSLSIRVPVRQTSCLPISLRFSLAQLFQVALFKSC